MVPMSSTDVLSDNCSRGEQSSDQNSWNFSKFGFEQFWATLKCHSFLDFDRSEKCYWTFFSTVPGENRTLIRTVGTFQNLFWKFFFLKQLFWEILGTIFEKCQEL